MKKIFFLAIILLILSLNVSRAGILDDAQEIEGKIIEFLGEDYALVVKGTYVSPAEKMTYYYLKKERSELANANEISDTEFYYNFSGVAILLGGPYQNYITKELLSNKDAIVQENEYSIGIVTFVTYMNKKYIIFSDNAGYNNLPRTSAGKSPLTKFIPIAYVPAAATGISFFLLWLWNLLLKVLPKILKKSVANNILKKVKKKELKHEFLGFHFKGIRVKFREWFSICISAIIFALTISYTYYMTRDDIAVFILSTILVNAIIYSIRHLIRLLMDVHHEIHTEYHIWFFGAIITLISGFLGNTFSLAGYTISDETKTANEGKIQFMINTLTVVASASLFVWNIFFPNVIVQMSMILGISIAFLQLLPFTPFSGKKIYTWSKIAWIMVFIPSMIFYGFVNLVV